MAVVVITGEITMTVTEEKTMIVTITEEVIVIVTVTVTEEAIAIVIVTEEMTVIGKEILLVAVIMMILFKPEPLVDSRISALVVARTRVSKQNGKRLLRRFPNL